MPQSKSTNTDNPWDLLSDELNMMDSCRPEGEHWKTVAELAIERGVSTTATRTMLENLRSRGMVERVKGRSTGNVPAFFYRPTPA